MLIDAVLFAKSTREGGSVPSYPFKVSTMYSRGVSTLLTGLYVSSFQQVQGYISPLARPGACLILGYPNQGMNVARKVCELELSSDRYHGYLQHDALMHTRHNDLSHWEISE